MITHWSHSIVQQKLHSDAHTPLLHARYCCTYDTDSALKETVAHTALLLVNIISNLGEVAVLLVGGWVHAVTVCCTINFALLCELSRREQRQCLSSSSCVVPPTATNTHVWYPLDYWISFTLCSYCNYAIVQVAIGRKLKVAIITPIAHCPSAVSSLPAHLTIGKKHSPLQLPTTSCQLLPWTRIWREMAEDKSRAVIF